MKFSLFILLIVLTYVHYSLAGGCFCYSRTGTYCGFQREHHHLGGDCSRDNMYTCRGGNGALAGWEGRCRRGRCVGSNPAGRDYCPHGSERGRRKRFISNLEKI
uniref:Venom peptide meuPep34 n=1 Tax=Mesobuthus eupeus TaxID=34648 RepID=A0A146CJ43_MESEU|nr:venom peptide meuPep34 [Mesobuthus eupeus]